MTNKITVYKDTKSVIDGGLRTRTILENEELPKGCYWTEEEALIAYKHNQQKELDAYNKHLPEANSILSKLEKDIKDLLKKSNSDLYFSYEGDTHGIYDERIELSTTINKHNYTKQVYFD